MTNSVDTSVATKVNEIKAQPYAKYIISEDVIERNFGYKIIRQQVSAGKNSLVYKCEKAKHSDVYCLVKAYKLGREKIKYCLREEICQIMRFVTGKCPQVISTFDMFYTNEKIYLMCDWASRGEVLNNIRLKSVKLNEEMLHNWALDILNAVNFLHGNAICHRNIAPSCLLLTQDFRLKIGTLGDAVVYCKPDGTLLRQKWAKFSRAGNWNQAPEVAKGKQYDPRRADIWSIGATIYWFITKSYPIDYSSRSKLTKQLEHKLGNMHKVSQRCQNFVKKMLTFQPPSRPTIAQAMQIDWVTSGVSPVSTTAAKEAPAEITTPEKIQDPGEATGPEETYAEPETSTSKKEGAVKATVPAEATEKPAEGENTSSK